METLKGFTIYVGEVDVFIESDKIRKTQSLAKEIIRKLNGTERFDIPDNASGVYAVLYYLRNANCDIKKLPDGREIHSIYGKGFNICGILGDATTLIIRK